MTHYEIRTTRGTPVYTFDSEQRAMQERERLAKKHGTTWSVWQIERVEKCVA